MSAKTMALLALQLIAMIAVTRAITMCPSENVCSCDGIVLKCVCNSRENVTISAVLNFDIIHVVVRGCGNVIIPLGSMTHLQLETIEFSDIYNLNVQPFALAGVQTISTLTIANISNFIVKSHGFSGLFNVSNITISNVTSENLSMGAFGGLSDIEYFLIENSRFENVEQLAFILSNVTNFRVINSHFRNLDNISILIHNSEEVSFHDCTFEETGNNTFSMSHVDTLAFRNCNFGSLATSSILTKSLGTFSFMNCTVELLKSDAFTYLEVTDRVLFISNIIKIADENSLIPNVGPYSGTITKNLDLEIWGNSFTCDCNIFWIWKTNKMGMYDDILVNNVCIDNRTKTLSSMAPVMDSSLNCMTLELKSFQMKTTLPDDQVYIFKDAAAVSKGNLPTAVIEISIFISFLVTIL